MQKKVSAKNKILISEKIRKVSAKKSMRQKR